MKEQDYITENKPSISSLKLEVIELLKKLIATPSFSKEENLTCDIIESFLIEKGILVNKKFNNVWCMNKFFDDSKPTILLNSHHDTVKPNSAYTNNPFEAFVDD